MTGLRITNRNNSRASRLVHPDRAGQIDAASATGKNRMAEDGHPGDHLRAHDLGDRLDRLAGPERELSLFSRLPGELIPVAARHARPRDLPAADGRAGQHEQAVTGLPRFQDRREDGRRGLRGREGRTRAVRRLGELVQPGLGDGRVAAGGARRRLDERVPVV